MISKLYTFACKEKELEEWLLANPMFYDKGCKAYCDTRKKKSAINDKCKEKGIEKGGLQNVVQLHEEWVWQADDAWMCVVVYHW